MTYENIEKWIKQYKTHRNVADIEKSYILIRNMRQRFVHGNVSDFFRINKYDNEYNLFIFTLS